MTGPFDIKGFDHIRPKGVPIMAEFVLAVEDAEAQFFDKKGTFGIKMDTTLFKQNFPTAIADRDGWTFLSQKAAEPAQVDKATATA